MLMFFHGRQNYEIKVRKFRDQEILSRFLIGWTVFKDLQSIERSLKSIERERFFLIIPKTNHQIGLFHQVDAQALVELPRQPVASNDCSDPDEFEVVFIVDD